MKKTGQLLSNFMKQLFATCPFLRTIELSIRFKRLYKNNFGHIKFQGQSFQDMIAFLYLKDRNKGFYMDIGAHDGIGGSNTYVFEQIGWDGICIEPQPDIYNKLRKYRKCRCYNVALSSMKNDSADFFKTAISGLSGLDEGMPESRKQCLKEYGKTEIIKVKTMTFDEIMKDHPNVKHIDFMSMDVEGHEIKILETINFEKYTFGLVTIENNDPEKIKALMSKNGYKVFMKIGDDTMFIPE